MSKAQLRKEIQAKLQGVPLAKFLSDGDLVTKNYIIPWLFEEGIDKTWQAGTFKSMKWEISTDPLNKWLTKLQVPQYLPVLSENGQLSWSNLDTQANPTSPSISVIFVPGLAFDKQGHRLGRGGGFYDRVLAILVKEIPFPLIVGLAMDAQIVEHVPIEPNDVAVDFLCTPTLGLFRTCKE